MGYCFECKQKLIEIDNRGEHLTGCLTCNAALPGWSQLGVADVAATFGGRGGLQTP